MDTVTGLRTHINNTLDAMEAEEKARALPPGTLLQLFIKFLPFILGFFGITMPTLPTLPVGAKPPASP